MWTSWPHACIAPFVDFQSRSVSSVTGRASMSARRRTIGRLARSRGALPPRRTAMNPVTCSAEWTSRPSRSISARIARPVSGRSRATSGMPCSLWRRAMSSGARARASVGMESIDVTGLFQGCFRCNVSPRGAGRVESGVAAGVARGWVRAGWEKDPGAPRKRDAPGFSSFIEEPRHRARQRSSLYPPEAPVIRLRRLPRWCSRWGNTDGPCHH